MDIIQVISRAVSILLKDTKTTENVCIEAHIYALQYIRYCTNADNQAYTFAVEYVYKMIPEEYAISFDSFGDYFETRCQWYEEMHCKVAKAKQEGNNMPIAWGIMQHLIFTFPLQNVDKKDVGQYAFTHTDIFDNMNFIESSLSMLSFLHEALCNNAQQMEDEEDTIESLDNGEYNNYDDYDDADAAQVIAKQLVQKYGKEKAICIVETILEQSLIAYDESPNSQGAWSCIDKSCQLLDILCPIDTGGWYSHCKSKDELADYLTIDYISINDAIKRLHELSKRAMMRATSLAVVMTGPPMKIMAEKFYALNAMYEGAIEVLAKIKKQITETSHKERKFEDTGDILSSRVYSIDGKVCGFISHDKIHLNSDMGNHKAPIHLYTYLWMKYCKKANNELYYAIIDLISKSAYFYHIQYGNRFTDLNKEEIAIKAFCYLVAFDAADLFINEKLKSQLISSELAEFQTFNLLRIIDITIDEAKRLPLISFIRGDKIISKDI